MASTVILLLRIFLLTLLKSTTLVSSERWKDVWDKMNAINQRKINFMSSCPWKYVKDPSTRHYTPKLLQIHEKWCTNCCIDLTQSNSSTLVINPRGQCSPIRAPLKCNGAPVVVGYTCVYAYSVSTDKRNEGQGPIVNNKMTSEPSSSTLPTHLTTKTSDKKSQTTKTKKEPEKSENDFNKEQHDRYTTALSQHIVPPFLGNVQYNKPPFLENNAGQFRPGFLNGLNAQIGQPPLMPMFPLNEHMENTQRGAQTAGHQPSVGEETELVLVETETRDETLDETGVERKGEQLEEENGQEPLR